MTTDDLMNDYAMLKSTLDRLGIKYEVKNFSEQLIL